MNQPLGVSPDTSGLLYNIQRYNLHDGPGIRTMIFFKGCPLRCPWCANPESQSFDMEEMDGETVGYTLSAREAVDKASRDCAFFQRSDGGITLSGGEIMAQPDFAQAIIEEAKRRGIHVTLESACCTDRDTFARVTSQADVLLADIKLMDAKRHLEIVGMSNRGILENIRQFATSGKEVVVRVPVIPGYNDDEKNLRETAAFCRDAKIGEINLLPYHEMGANKYKKLGRTYALASCKPPAKAALQELAAQLTREFGLQVKVL